jgi:rRNA-processing protein FCF1
MNMTETLLLVTMLAVLAEVTYLVVKLPRQTSKRSSGRSILVDTSVLIDGRIVAVAKSGFIGGTLVIPRSVIGELQFLADNADHDKRMRARYGLDVVTELQNIPQVVVEILQDGSKAEEGVDERLLTLAKKSGAAVCTIDYNLNKVAVVEGIQVVNVNELAQELRMAHLPGERIFLELVQKGQDSHQAVGYLGDGTMVVVEHASKLIGKPAEIEFIRSLQTAAGKMMFAKLVEQQKDVAIATHNKPVGKKPVVTKQENHQDSQRPANNNDKRRSWQQPPVAQHVEETKQQPAQEQQKPMQQQPQSAGRSKQQRRQKDREAALLDLVDKQ